MPRSRLLFLHSFNNSLQQTVLSTYYVPFICIHKTWYPENEINSILHKLRPFSWNQYIWLESRNISRNCVSLPRHCMQSVTESCHFYHLSHFQIHLLFSNSSITVAIQSSITFFQTTAGLPPYPPFSHHCFSLRYFLQIP